MSKPSAPSTAFTSSAPLSSRSEPGQRTLPPWVRVAASLAIVFHLLALGVLALAAPSGPWSIRYGDSAALGPFFATKINDVTANNYLRHLGMAHNYHFDSNRTQHPSVYLEVKLWDEQGAVTTLRLPDPKANPWVRARQHALAQSLGEDQTFQPSIMEAIPAPGQKSAQVKFFYPPERQADTYELFEEDESRVPRDRPMLFRPSDWSLILARSYVRHLQGEHGAAKVELVRHSREPLMPALMMPFQPVPGKLLLDQPPPGMLDELVCNFGDGRPKRLRPIDGPK